MYFGSVYTCNEQESTKGHTNGKKGSYVSTQFFSNWSCMLYNKLQQNIYAYIKKRITIVICSYGRQGKASSTINSYPLAQLLQKRARLHDNAKPSRGAESNFAASGSVPSGNAVQQLSPLWMSMPLSLLSVESRRRNRLQWLCVCVSRPGFLQLLTHFSSIFPKQLIKFMDSTPGWLIDHFQFLTFGHSGAQGWTPECSKVKN